MDVQYNKKAIELRRLGYSYTDIARELKVSRASVCSWVKKVRLTEVEKSILAKNVKTKIERGRMKALITIRSKSVFKEKIAYDSAEKEFEKFLKDPLFTLGLGLCTTGGVKKGSSFQFSTSDPKIMKIILLWIEKYFGFKKNTLKYRLFLAVSHKNAECEQFWSKSLGISEKLFQKTVHLSQNTKKSPEYKGSLCLTVSNIEMVRRIIAWQKLTIRYYD